MDEFEISELEKHILISNYKQKVGDWFVGINPENLMQLKEKVDDKLIYGLFEFNKNEWKKIGKANSLDNIVWLCAELYNKLAFNLDGFQVNVADYSTFEEFYMEVVIKKIIGENFNYFTEGKGESYEETLVIVLTWEYWQEMYDTNREHVMVFNAKRLISED